MFWVICIVAVVAFIVYKITKEYKESVNDTVGRYGGMQEKYKTLINYLEGSGCKITKVTSDGIAMSEARTYWTIDVVGNEVEIRMEALSPLLFDAKCKKKWVYPHNYPQEDIIEEIDNYLAQEMRNFFSKMQAKFKEKE